MTKFILLIILFSSFSQAGSMQSFLDDSINTAVENPGYYQSQTRGLYTLGSGRLRFNNNQSFSPFHLEAPRFGMGCGGIDATVGGFSYLHVDYLVEKLKAKLGPGICQYSKKLTEQDFTFVIDLYLKEELQIRELLTKYTAEEIINKLVYNNTHMKKYESELTSIQRRVCKRDNFYIGINWPESINLIEKEL